MLNIACDFVVLLWRQKCLSKTSKSNAKKQLSHYKKHLLSIDKHYMDNKVAFLRYLWSKAQNVDVGKRT